MEAAIKKGIERKVIGKSIVPALCDECGNEPVEYEVKWVLFQEPVYLCRFCKADWEDLFKEGK